MMEIINTCMRHKWHYYRITTVASHDYFRQARNDHTLETMFVVYI